MNMKKQLLFLMLMLITCFSKAQDTTKVLFIGNSITYFNNMPQTFEAIANSQGDYTEVTVYAPGGTGFIHHVNDPNIYAHFKQERWDYIVLQPGSNESPGYTAPINQTLTRARVMVDSIYKYNPCANVLFYEISYGVWGATPANLVTYNTTMGGIRNNLTYLSDSMELFFAPVGEAFRTAWNNDQTTMLWGGVGDIHPNARGSYIAACIFYASIFKKPSLGTTEISSLTATEAMNYQQLADTIVLDSLANWRIGKYDQITNFTYQVNGDTVAFNNLSQNIDSMWWDFGDATFSSDLNPRHQYIASGSYEVTLTTYKNGCVQVMQDTIAIGILNHAPIMKHHIENIVVYPNPANDLLNIRVQDQTTNYRIEIYNSVGTLVMIVNNKVQLPIVHLPQGMYTLQIVNKETGSKQVKKWVKDL